MKQAYEALLDVCKLDIQYGYGLKGTYPSERLRLHAECRHVLVELAFPEGIATFREPRIGLFKLFVFLLEYHDGEMASLSIKLQQRPSQADCSFTLCCKSSIYTSQGSQRSYLNSKDTYSKHLAKHEESEETE